MPNFTIDWDNTNALAEANIIAQRASIRVKTVGGAYITTGFTPANDLAKSINSVESPSILGNKVYEIKVESICTTGGPTLNDNGIQEQIVFVCIAPTFTPYADSIDVNINLGVNDITEGTLTLKKQSDNSLIETVDVPRIANNLDYSFTGLEANTGYYLEVIFKAIVGGVEVLSNDVLYLGAVCGGNTSGYQSSTITEPNISVSNISTDMELTNLEIDGVPVVFDGIDQYPVPTGQSREGFLATAPVVSVEVFFTMVDITQSVWLYDTNGTLQCTAVAGPYTFTGVDMTGPNQLIIELKDGICP